MPATDHNPVSPPSPIIRIAGPEEAAAIAALIQRSFAQYRGRLVPPAAALGVTAESIAWPAANGQVLVAGDGGAPVGCVILEDRGDLAYAGRLAVDPAARGKGIGVALMRAAEAAARALGRHRLRVETRLILAGNRAFFRRLGFVEGARHCHPGFTHPTYLEMEKMLV